MNLAAPIFSGLNDYNSPSIIGTVGLSPIPPVNPAVATQCSGQLKLQTGGDPISRGIYIPGPLTDFTLTLRYNNFAPVSLLGLSADSTPAADDAEYFAHLVVQPILKSYDMPVRAI